MNRAIVLFSLILTLSIPIICDALPAAIGARVTDVTPNSFSMVWASDVPSVPSVEVYDGSGVEITDSLNVVSMYGVDESVAAAANGRNVFRITVTGLEPGTEYSVRAVTADASDPESVTYTELQRVETADEVRVYDDDKAVFANDLATFAVYLIPAGDYADLTGSGQVVLFDIYTSPYPVSAVVGDNTTYPEGVIDLNNLFCATGKSLNIPNVGDGVGKENIALLTVYRGGGLPELYHYRIVYEAVSATTPKVVEVSKGPSEEDVDISGQVDDTDIEMFREHYNAGANDPDYNPDYDFEDPNGNADGVIDVRDFSDIAGQYGNPNL